MTDTRIRHRSIDGLVRVGPLMAIPAILRELGQEPRALMLGAGLNQTQFNDPDTEIPYLAASKLLAHCVAATGCSHFGLLVGTRAGPSSLGVAGFMLQNAPDVGTALRDLVQHLDLHDQGGVAVLQTNSRAAQIGYAIHQPGAEAADQIYDLSMAVACNIMRSLCGERWSPSEVLLARRVPRDLAPYSQFFRAPLHFNADRSAVVFPPHWLGHRMQRADALLHQHLEKQAAQLHKVRDADIVVDLRVLLRKSLLAEQCTVANISRQLCLHERSLHRRLREHGTSFRRELDGARYELSRQLLGETTMSIVKISKVLNYTDASAFSRAFKRWTGDTPARWRAHTRRSS